MNERRVNDVELPLGCIREMPGRCSRLPSPLWEDKEALVGWRDCYRAVVLPGCSAVVPGAGAGGVTGAAAAAAGVPAGLIQNR